MLRIRRQRFEIVVVDCCCGHREKCGVCLSLFLKYLLLVRRQVVIYQFVRINFFHIAFRNFCLLRNQTIKYTRYVIKNTVTKRKEAGMKNRDNFSSVQYKSVTLRFILSKEVVKCFDFLSLGVL